MKLESFCESPVIATKSYFVKGIVKKQIKQKRKMKGKTRYESEGYPYMASTGYRGGDFRGK